MKIRRFYLDRLASLLQPGKVLAVYGPRRAGKTTLLADFLASWRGGRYFLGTGEDRAVRAVRQRQAGTFRVGTQFYLQLT